MDRLLSLTRQQLTFFICCGMTVALIYSKFALTIGMILLLLISLIDLGDGGSFRLRFNSEIKTNFKKLWQRKDFLVITLFFFIVLFSGIYSSDLNFLSERLRIKLPFLLLPFAFVSIPSLSEKQYHSIFYLFNIVIAFSALLVGFNYWMDFESITKSMGMGQAIPTPTNHIRYSLLLAFSILSGMALWWKGFFLKYKWEPYFILSLSLISLIMIHVLSVRSGLLVLYISILFLSLRFMFLSKRYLIGMALIAGLFLTPFLAYKTLPSLQKKVSYMLYDYDQFKHGNIKNLSDGERFTSMMVGIKVGNENPLIGVGVGDLKQSTAAVYQKEFPNVSKPKLPHNQLISIYASTGILGLFIFIFAFFFPLWYQQNYRNVLLTILHVIVFCSFFIENTIETAVGVAFYCLFLMLGLNRKNDSA